MSHARVRAPGRSAPTGRARRPAPRSPARRPTPTSTRSSRARLRRPARCRRSPAGASPPSTRARRAAAARRRSPCSPTRTRRGWRDTSDAELASCSPPRSHFRGQIVGAVVAETPEVGPRGRRPRRVTYDAASRTSTSGPTARPLRPRACQRPTAPTDTSDGDVDAALARRRRRSSTRPTPPRWSTTTRWSRTPPSAPLGTTSAARRCTTRRRACTPCAPRVAALLGLGPRTGPRDVARTSAAGSGPRASSTRTSVLAAMAARLVPGRPVKLALTRQQMFTLVGHRTPTIQRVRLGADADGTLAALSPRRRGAHVAHQGVRRADRRRHAA